MTVVVIIFLPLVLAYQAWSYYIFRRRVSATDFQRPAEPAAGTPASAPAPTAAPTAAGQGQPGAT
jgi:cytochrome d ubiquinol oxidase subunit II